MSALAQQILTILLCLAAASYLAWQAMGMFARRKSGCGRGCGSCELSPSPAAQVKSLLTLELGDSTKPSEDAQ